MKKNISVLLRGYRVLHGLLPGFLPAAGIKAIVSALYPFINIVMTARIVNAFAAKKDSQMIMTLVLITILLNFAAQAIIHLLKRVSAYLSVNIWYVNEKPLNEKQQEMDYILVENPETHLLRTKIFTYRNTSGQSILMLFWTFDDLITSLFTVIFSISLFLPVFMSISKDIGGAWDFIGKPWFSFAFLMIMLGSAALSSVIVSVRTKKVYKSLEGFHSSNMVGQYFVDKLVQKYQMGKDVKIYSMKRVIFGLFENLLSSVAPHIRNWAKTESRYTSLGDLATCLLSALVYIFVAVKAILGFLGVGSIVQYIGSITRFNAGLAGLVGTIASLFSSVEPLSLYYKFLDKPNVMHHGTLPVEKRDDHEYEIEFHHVSFKYPDTNSYALQDLSMKLHVGQRMAVVGMNGSGKTTMVKLLCRLYDPTDGIITLNGIDIRKYDYSEYMSLFSVVFQDFKLFSFPLGQNVAVSMSFDEQRAQRCLAMAGFSKRLASMPKGLETPLYKDFDEDGVEISGGEAQKIVLARALYKDAPFVVLDEPTAALDPVAEFDVYSRFNEIVGSKTAVFISHRLSSCRFCDDIAVFHEGSLIQRGNHDTLLADQNGKYHELWNAQAQYYK